MMRIKHLWILLFFSFFIFLSSILIFSQIYEFSDLVLHSQFITDYLNGDGELPANFLYYRIILFFGTQETLKTTTIFILSAFVVSKFFISWLFLMDMSKEVASEKMITLIFLTVALLIVAPIFLPQMIFGRAYLGSFAYNIWHNSTTIAVMPFAILLFWQSCKQLEIWSTGRLCFILILIFLNAIIKPSYLFVYVLALPLIAFMLHKDFMNFIKYIAIVVFTGLLIGAQFLMIYLSENHFGDKHDVMIKPFLVYRIWHSTVPMIWVVGIFLISFISSLAFPIYVFTKQKVNQDIFSLFSIVSVVIALLIAILFAEIGPRVGHGNFFWQLHISSYIIFLVATVKALPYLVHFKLDPKKKYYQLNMYQILFMLHLGFGALYIFKLIFRGSYS